MRLHNKKTQSGRSMIEMLGVLAIVGVLSAGGIAGYSMAMQSYKASALMEKVNLIAQQARNIYNGDYTESTTDNTNGSIGGKLIAGGLISDVDNPFGGKLVTAPANGGEEFTITTSNNIPQEVCVKIMTSNWGDVGVISSIAAGEKAITKFPATPANAISTCTGSTNVMVWTLK